MGNHFQMTGESLGLVAGRFKVLSEPTTQPNVSKHLKILQDAGLVSRRQEGNTAWYSIADPSVFALCDLVCGSLRERLESQAEMFRGAAEPARRKR
jgi:DNA-binding transcriptional ArsR family regulator